jgi:hypothetical protein
LTGQERVVEARAGLWLDADDLGTSCIPSRNPAYQPTPAARHQDVGEVRCILLELPPHGALTCQYVDMIVSMDLQRTVLRLALAGGY